MNDPQLEAKVCDRQVLDSETELKIQLLSLQCAVLGAVGVWRSVFQEVGFILQGPVILHCSECLASQRPEDPLLANRRVLV